MKVIDLSRSGKDYAIAAALEVLGRGSVVACPTETFYGLMVRYDMVESLMRLHELKGRPADKSMPLIVGDLGALDMVVSSLNEGEKTMVNKYWPGPLSLLLSARPGLSDYICRDWRVCVRIPGESFALDLARRAGYPMTSTSANPSGFPPAMDAKTVAMYFDGAIDLIVDGGETRGGLPSTIAEVRGGEIALIRKGAVEIEGAVRG